MTKVFPPLATEVYKGQTLIITSANVAIFGDLPPRVWTPVGYWARFFTKDELEVMNLNSNSSIEDRLKIMRVAVDRAERNNPV